MDAHALLIRRLVADRIRLLRSRFGLRLPEAAALALLQLRIRHVPKNPRRLS